MSDVKVFIRTFIHMMNDLSIGWTFSFIIDIGFIIPRLFYQLYENEFIRNNHSILRVGTHHVCLLSIFKTSLWSNFGAQERFTV